ncbi:uncharacterized protein LOC144106245 isoform X2 [Amblyomma americanum]
MKSSPEWPARRGSAASSMLRREESMASFIGEDPRDVETFQPRRDRQELKEKLMSPLMVGALAVVLLLMAFVLVPLLLWNTDTLATPTSAATLNDFVVEPFNTTTITGPPQSTASASSTIPMKPTFGTTTSMNQSTTMIPIDITTRLSSTEAAITTKVTVTVNTAPSASKESETTTSTSVADITTGLPPTLSTTAGTHEESTTTILTSTASTATHVPPSFNTTAGSAMANTTTGQLNGTAVDIGGVRLHRWLAVPYAEPGKRFVPAEPLSVSQQGVIDASQEASPCAQLVDGVLMGSEDCLHINVWAPADRAQPGAVRPLVLALSTDWFLQGSNNIGEWEQLAATGDASAPHDYVKTFLGPQAAMSQATVPSLPLV